MAALVGAWVISEAARFGIPRIALARMILNLLIDLGIGAIPVVGDLYDVVSRSNSLNLDLFSRHALDPEASTAEHKTFFAGLVLLLIGAIWLVAVVAIRLLEWVSELLG